MTTAVAVTVPPSTARPPVNRPAQHRRSRSPFHAALDCARHDVAIVYGGNDLTHAAIQQDKLTLRSLLHRWVHVCAIWDDRALAAPHLASYASWQATSGIRIRAVARTPVTFALLDHQTSVVGQDEGLDGGLDGSVTTSDCSETTGMLRYVFHGLWEEGTPLTAGGHAPDDEQFQDVLRLLASGYTDEQIAASLDVSKRTVSRTVSRLMQELNAQSRFEAGALAARRGWLHKTAGPAERDVRRRL
ncbi:helix-turn-helix transcriptional regulator [Streptomyces broussonetiae]|uniref:helix-turn-helix transcriptional regulator n=1 Tax=Streptomyces broussonetiae TaxID=2686304 RepID=UPI0035DE0873